MRGVWAPVELDLHALGLSRLHRIDTDGTRQCAIIECSGTPYPFGGCRPSRGVDRRLGIGRTHARRRPAPARWPARPGRALGHRHDPPSLDHRPYAPHGRLQRPRYSHRQARLRRSLHPLLQVLRPGPHQVAGQHGQWHLVRRGTPGGRLLRGHYPHQRHAGADHGHLHAPQGHVAVSWLASTSKSSPIARRSP